MSKEAFDPASMSIVSANNSLSRNEYRCIHPDCDAILHICYTDNPYFAANPKNPHIDTCPYRADSTYDPMTKIPEEFEIHEFLEDLITRPYKERKGSNQPPKNTIKKRNSKGEVSVYVNSIASFANFCRSHAMDTVYDGTHEISEICVDGRNVNKLWAKFEGTKLIIGNIKYFNIHNNTFGIKISSKLNTKLYANIEVKVSHLIMSDLFKKLINRFNSTTNVPVAILCNCDYIGKYNCNGYEYKNLVRAYLNSLNQIHIL